MKFSNARVLDFGWNWTGPMAGRFLADLGAQVIKIESPKRPDPIRYIPGKKIKQADHGLVRNPKFETHPFFHNVNRGKFGFTVDLTKVEGKALLEELISKSDAIIENFSAGVLDRMGLSYERLVKIKKDIIVVSMSIAGQKGPKNKIKGYAAVSTGLGGLEANIGYDGECTGGLTFAYGDPNGAMFGIFALACAFYHKERTGKGLYVDLSQMEAITSLLHEAFWLHHLVPGELGAKVRRGDGHIVNDVFPCRGKDKWIAISVSNPITLVGLSQLIPSIRGITDDGNQSFLDKIGKAITEWTSDRLSDEAFELLQRNGVPAAPVLNVNHLPHDPHFKARNIAEIVDHPLVGEETTVNLPWKFSGYRPDYNRAPYLGEHTVKILKEILSKSDAEIEDLKKKEII